MFCHILNSLFYVVHFQVENSADAESLMLADEIVNCGYTSQIKLDSKENISFQRITF